MLLDAGWAPVVASRHWYLNRGLGDRCRPFEAVDLPAHWARLDTFERAGSERVVSTVHMPKGDVEASIYVLVRVQDYGLVEPASIDRPIVSSASARSTVGSERYLSLEASAFPLLGVGAAGRRMAE
jgi:hypothetical protein